jgi:hypothetical protein
LHARPTFPTDRDEQVASHTDNHKSIKTFFGLKKGKEETGGQSQTSKPAPSAKDIFWPEEFLVPDLPQARIWTYGYSADVIGGFFTANNKNSISQHGRDFAVRLEREIDNEVCLFPSRLLSEPDDWIGSDRVRSA